jgi:hypothetical protein
MSEELKEAISGLPHIQKVFITEDGNWHFNKPKKEHYEVSRAEILGEEAEVTDETGNESEVKKPVKGKKPQN